MKGKIIGEDQGDYFISGADGKRYQFANWDWSGKSRRRLVMLLILCVKGIPLNLFSLS